MRTLGKHSTNRVTVLTCLNLQTWEGQKEKERCRPGHGLRSLLVTCSCESQLVTKYFAPSTPAHQPPVQSGLLYFSSCIQCSGSGFYSSAWCTWATPGVFASLGFPCLCNGGAGHACLGVLAGLLGETAAQHLAHT